MHNPVQHDRSEFNVVFVHSDLDDLKLTPVQFRVYCHLARRAGAGQAWPAVKSVAEVCCVHHDTARNTLKELTAMNLVVAETRQGKTTLYRLTKRSEWNPSLKTDPPETKGGHPPETKGGHPPETKGGEVYPLKAIPEVTPPASEKPGAHKQFIASWCDAYLEANGAKYFFLGAKDASAVKRLLGLGVGVDELMFWARKAWGHPALFNCKQASSIAGFASRFNEIRSELKAKGVRHTQASEGATESSQGW